MSNASRIDRLEKELVRHEQMIQNLREAMLGLNQMLAAIAEKEQAEKKRIQVVTS